MPIPIAYFAYSKDNTTVTFRNASINSPETFLWEFGDGTTSEDENPTHIFPELGFFTVKFTVTNADGSDTLIQTININSNTDSLDSSILELVEYYIPRELLSEVTSKEKIALIRKWQLYLQPLVEIPYKVDVSNTYDEFKWPGLVNHLISQLVAYDVIIQLSNLFVANSASNNTNEGSNNTSTNQQLKSIETGPAKTEWYEESKDEENIKNVSTAITNATKPGGSLSVLKENICQLSKRVRIFLPMCGPLPNTIVPEVATKCKQSGHNSNPFGVNSRMT